MRGTATTARRGRARSTARRTTAGSCSTPDGNSVEAVHRNGDDAVPDGRVDHLWLRVRDPLASRRFYTTIAPHAGLRLARDEPGRVQLSGPDYSLSLVRDERQLTEHVHLAFPASRPQTCPGSVGGGVGPGRVPEEAGGPAGCSFGDSVSDIRAYFRACPHEHSGIRPRQGQRDRATSAPSGNGTASRSRRHAAKGCRVAEVAADSFVPGERACWQAAERRDRLERLGQSD